LRKTDLPYYQAYKSQKGSSKKRKIEWQFTYETWIKKWEESGLLHLRGRGKGKMVMSRYGDIGPYNPENTSIQLHRDNLKEAHTGHVQSKEHRRKIGDAQRGEKDHQAKLTEKDVIEIRNLAKTSSQRYIAERYGISNQQVNRIVHRINWAHIP
jgi:hypothetical protein